MVPTSFWWFLFCFYSPLSLVGVYWWCSVKTILGPVLLAAETAEEHTWRAEVSENILLRTAKEILQFWMRQLGVPGTRSAQTSASQQKAIREHPADNNLCLHTNKAPSGNLMVYLKLWGCWLLFERYFGAGEITAVLFVMSKGRVILEFIVRNFCI